MKEFVENWRWLIDLASAIGIVCAAFFAAWAAFAAWRSANETRKTMLAQLIMQIADAYASEEMLHGMLGLREWQKMHRANWVKDFVDLRKSDYSKVKSEDEARRRYSHHFYKIWLLLDTKIVDKSFVKKVVGMEEVDFLLSVIEPLEKGINPNYNHSTFDTFRRIYHE